MACTELMKNQDQAEIVFTFEELFFSRTDKKGLIQAGNNVFQRISMYSWNELLHKPHNLIRHPDMPKGVFCLFWDTLKNNQPIGAYVKNRAKDGRYYWVFAIATPIEDGYISVRIKPSSHILKTIEHEYKNFVAMEHTGTKAPDSAAILLERLKELGFNTYQEFMAVALSTEIIERNQQLGRTEDTALRCFMELLVSAQSLLKQSESVFNAYASNRYVPLNLQIQSAQLGESGATIGVISGNYTIISGEIRENMGQFTESAQQVYNTIIEGMFLVCTAKIQQEVIDFFHHETTSEYISQEQEMSYLSTQQQSYQQKALEGLEAIMRQVSAFQHSCQDMKRLAAGLGVTRIMGKVETARIPTEQSSMDDLINDLENFQETITDSLKEIERLNRQIGYNIESLLYINNKKAQI